jgi:hypothetical protein
MNKTGKLLWILSGVAAELIYLAARGFDVQK